MSKNNEIQDAYDEIDRCNERIKAENEQKADIFGRLKGRGYNVARAKQAFAVKKRGIDKHNEESAEVVVILNKLL